jgi:hypothetical protein
MFEFVLVNNMERDLTYMPVIGRGSVRDSDMLS